MLNQSIEQKIVDRVASAFPCFGKGSTDVSDNPIWCALKDAAPTFAAGVDVRDVVAFVLQAYYEARYVLVEEKS